MSQVTDGRRHMNGLDGLRAIAVMAVIAYHLNLGFIPGGLLGVGMFFVLSGYLITDILLSQWQAHGRIALGDFWLRRARRLLPGMLTMTAVVMVWLLFTDPSRLASLRGDIISGILYISNWWYIFHHVSYFESFGPPSPFGHFWSLAVEEQFYLVWPLILIASIALFKRKGWLVVFIVVVAELSAGAMAILYDPNLDPSRVYYGTDTRAFALLSGAALAVVWPSRKLSASIAAKGRMIMDVVGVVVLGILVYMLLTSSEYDSSLYMGGMALQAVATTVLVAVLAHPASLLAKIIGAKPLRWIGERSYGMYLWHYPVIVLTNPAVDTDGANPVRMLLQVLATFVLASLSLKYIENPIRHNGFRNAFSGWWGKGRQNVSHHQLWGKRVALMMSLLLFCFTVSQMMVTSAANVDSHTESVSTAFNGDNKSEEDEGHTLVPDNNESSSSAGEQTVTTGDKPASGSNQTESGSNNQADPPSSSDKQTAAEDSGEGKPSLQEGQSATAGNEPKGNVPDSRGSKGGKSPEAPSNETGKEEDAPSLVKDGKIAYTVIGDSVILDAKPYLEKGIAGVYVDGHVGRQMWQAADVLTELAKSKQLGSRIVLELGTNGSFNSKSLNAVLDTLKDKERVYLVTVRVPRAWERTVNKALNDAESRYDNVSLIDWHSASEGHDEYFEHDGVHLTVEGSEAFADLVKSSIK